MQVPNTHVGSRVSDTTAFHLLYNSASSKLLQGAMRVGWVPFVASITGSFFSLGSANPTCKCLSYETCWPSASEFSLLASQLSQPLIKPVPFASACYPPSHPSGNCTNVLTHLADGRYRSKIPGAMEAINFETFIFENGTIDACYYNTTLGFPCEQGNIPVLGVEAREVSDIQAGVKFAAKHNLRLVIKNTGWAAFHCYCLQR